MNIQELKKIIPDRVFLKLIYRRIFKKRLNLSNPYTFNEKLQWLKLNDKNPKYIQMVDKLGVKNYIAELIGEEYIVPTINVWNKFDEININKLPKEFVLKCTHDSNSVVLCNDKSNFNFEKAKNKIDDCIKRNYYYVAREWPYKYIKPRIIAEPLLKDGNEVLQDYKFFCFNGECKFFKIDFDRFTNHHANYYDVKGRILNFGECVCPPDKTRKIVMPNNLNKMVHLAEKLSVGIPFLRVDFYEVKNKVYVGELTFFPAAGFGKFNPPETDLVLGEMLKLPFEK